MNFTIISYIYLIDLQELRSTPRVSRVLLCSELRYLSFLYGLISHECARSAVSSETERGRARAERAPRDAQGRRAGDDAGRRADTPREKKV